MANLEQVNLLKQGVDVWNEWRKENEYLSTPPSIDLSETNLQGRYLFEANLSRANLNRANLGGANLTRANLSGANLSGTDIFGADLHNADIRQSDLRQANLGGANLSRANLSEANLGGADIFGANLDGVNLSKANLGGADLREADLSESNLSGANLSRANLSRADLSEADLSEADLSEANLTHSVLVRTNVSNAKISKSNIYGINVWDLEGEFKEQKELIITPTGESAITVDNIEIAQFIYLILNNKKIRDVINTLTSKTVLILGRFSPERKAILDALRNKLREYDLLPILFDFDRPTDRDTTETIKTLAGISLFVIADITTPKSAPLELLATVPDYQIPFVPIIQKGEEPFSMMVNLQTKHNWVLDTISYDSLETLIDILKVGIIDPAIAKHNELKKIKASIPTIISDKRYIE